MARQLCAAAAGGTQQSESDPAAGGFGVVATVYSEDIFWHQKVPAEGSALQDGTPTAPSTVLPCMDFAEALAAAEEQICHWSLWPATGAAAVLALLAAAMAAVCEESAAFSDGRTHGVEGADDHAEDLPAAPLRGGARENDAYDGRQDVVDGHREAAAAEVF